MKTYVTFGQAHFHCINGVVFDHNCVGIIYCDSPEQGRALAFATFGRKFCFEYPEDQFPMDSMHYYPRGFVNVNAPTPQGQETPPARE